MDSVYNTPNAFTQKRREILKKKSIFISTKFVYKSLNLCMKYTHNITNVHVYKQASNNDFVIHILSINTIPMDTRGCIFNRGR